MPRTKEIVSEAKIEDLASNIRERRRRLQMTQAELGKEIGVTQQRIAMFEKGDAIPDIFQVQSIASVLNTTIETLLNLTSEEIMNNKNIVQETMNILASMQAREQLLESLNLRLNTSQGEASHQVQDWVGDLKEQQLSDIDLYKNNLLLPGQPQQDPISALNRILEPYGYLEYDERNSEGIVKLRVKVKETCLDAERDSNDMNLIKRDLERATGRYYVPILKPVSGSPSEDIRDTRWRYFTLHEKDRPRRMENE